MGSLNGGETIASNVEGNVEFKSLRVSASKNLIEYISARLSQVWNPNWVTGDSDT